MGRKLIMMDLFWPAMAGVIAVLGGMSVGALIGVGVPGAIRDRIRHGPQPKLPAGCDIGIHRWATPTDGHDPAKCLRCGVVQ